MAEGDVVIRYDFLPTESSLKNSANRAASEFKKKFEANGSDFSGVSGVSSSLKKSSKKLTNEFDTTVNSIIDLLRATQIKTSLQTKIMSGLRFFERIFTGAKEIKNMEGLTKYAQGAGKKSGMTLGEFSKAEKTIGGGGNGSTSSAETPSSVTRVGNWIN